MATSPSKASLTCAPSLRGVGRAGSVALTSMSPKSSPVIASAPDVSSERMMPIACTSVHGPVAPKAFERNCSGAPCFGENALKLLDVRLATRVMRSPSCIALAIPKSSSFAGEPLPPSIRKMFSGFTSRCAIPSSCTDASASITGRTSATAWASSSLCPPARSSSIRSDKGRPVSHSSTR